MKFAAPSAAVPAILFAAFTAVAAPRDVASEFVVAEGDRIVILEDTNGDTVTLKEPTGSTRAIPAKQIASRQQQKLSLMPDNISLGLTPQELVDLVEYLLSEPVAAKP